MARLLILFAHPALDKSRVHRRMVERVAAVDGVTFNDLYEQYPDFDVDVRREQALLAAHDVVVLQFPFYWYSTPPLVKQWEDLVLEHGWAYGTGGDALRGKTMLCAVSSGGSEAAYQPEGHNAHTVRQFLAPLEQTAKLCGMDFLAPFVVHGTHRLDEPEIEAYARSYGGFIEMLRDDAIDFDRARTLPRLSTDLEAIRKR